jgi:hypothetical protein
MPANELVRTVRGGQSWKMIVLPGRRRLGVDPSRETGWDGMIDDGCSFMFVHGVWHMVVRGRSRIVIGPPLREVLSILSPASHHALPSSSVELSRRRLSPCLGAFECWVLGPLRPQAGDDAPGRTLGPGLVADGHP